MMTTTESSLLSNFAILSPAILLILAVSAGGGHVANEENQLTKQVGWPLPLGDATTSGPEIHA